MGRPPPPELPHNPIEKDGSGCIVISPSKVKKIKKN